MTLNSLRPYVTKLFIRPLSNIFGFLGFTPNLLSAISLIFAILAGLFFYFKYILIAGLMVFLNSLFDAVDGELARNKSSTSLRGDFLDHVIDRYADIFILCGIILGGYVSLEIGIVVITGVLLTSYLGTQAQAVGVGRYYGGLIGRVDRLVLIILSSIINYKIYSLSILGWTMVFIAITSHVTALQRFIYIWRNLKE